MEEETSSINADELKEYVVYAKETAVIKTVVLARDVPDVQRRLGFGPLDEWVTEDSQISDIKIVLADAVGDETKARESGTERFCKR